MIKRDDIIWLAGLLEGEGWFGLKEGKYPIITLSMTDEDVVVGVACMWKARVCRYRNVHSIRVYGVHAIGWMMTLYPFLYERRKKMIANVIKFWKEHSYGRMPNGAPNGVRMAKCHPDRSMKAHDLCNSCYMIEYKKNRRLLNVVNW